MNLHLLRLRGSPKEMGRAHGAAAKEAGALEAVSFFGEFLDQAFLFQAQGQVQRGLRRWLRGLVGGTVERAFLEQIPARYRESAEAFAEASGISPRVMLRALVMPDVYSYLLARRHRFRSALPDFPWSLACTSLAVAQPGDDRHPLLLARNLDFECGRRWTLHPAVIEYQPPDGQKYASITSLGLETSGITAMNESGLCLCLHMNYSKRARAGGTPVVVAGHEIIRRARDLSEAVRIARSFRMGGGWSFVLASVRERNAIVLEWDSERLAVRGLENKRLVCTNHYLDPELAAHEYWITGGRRLDSLARYRTARDGLRGLNRPLRPADLALLLGDSVDPYSRAERAYACTLCQVHTVTSAVLDPASSRLLLAVGAAPLPQGPFVEVRLFPGPYAGGAWEAGSGKGPRHAARQAYGLAHDAYFPKRDLTEVLRHLVAATGADPEQELYWSVRALVHLLEGDVPAAERAILEAVDRPGNTYRVMHNRLWAGRILDAAGKREEALRQYRKVLEDPYFGPHARRGARRSWKSRRSRSLLIDFTLGEGILI